MVDTDPRCAYSVPHGESEGIPPIESGDGGEAGQERDAPSTSLGRAEGGSGGGSGSGWIGPVELAASARATSRWGPARAGEEVDAGPSRARPWRDRSRGVRV